MSETQLDDKPAARADSIAATRIEQGGKLTAEERADVVGVNCRWVELELEWR